MRCSPARVAPSPTPGRMAPEAACPWSSACFPAQAALFLGAPTCSSIGEKETLGVSKGPGVQPGPIAACGAEACDWGEGGACEGVPQTKGPRARTHPHSLPPEARPAFPGQEGRGQDGLTLPQLSVIMPPTQPQ